MAERKATEKFKHWRAKLLFLIAALFISIPLTLVISDVWVPLIEIVKVLGSIFHLSQPSEDWFQDVILDFRLPRILMGVLVGVALSTAGAVMQGLFRNPMADPYIIGTSSGAAVGAVVAMGLFFFSGLTPIMAFLGAMLSTFIVYKVAMVNGRVPVNNLLLVGIAVSFFLSAVLSLLIYGMGRDMHMIFFWLMGNLQPMGNVSGLYS